MKRTILLTIFFSCNLLGSAQGKSYGGPLGNKIEHIDIPKGVVIKQIFRPGSPFSAQVLKTKGISPSYFLYVSERSKREGVAKWAPYFFCPLGKKLKEFIVLEIEGHFFFYFRAKKGEWLKVHFLTVPDKKPTVSSVFLFIMIVLFFL